MPTENTDRAFNQGRLARRKSEPYSNPYANAKGCVDAFQFMCGWDYEDSEIKRASSICEQHPPRMDDSRLDALATMAQVAFRDKWTAYQTAHEAENIIAQFSVD